MRPRPLVRRTPDGHRYAVPPTAQAPVPDPPRQPVDGHASAPEPTPRAKLTADDVREARAWHREGRFGVGDLAYIFGVSRSNMYAVLSRHTWRDVEDDA